MQQPRRRGQDGRSFATRRVGGFLASSSSGRADLASPLVEAAARRDRGGSPVTTPASSPPAAFPLTWLPSHTPAREPCGLRQAGSRAGAHSSASFFSTFRSWSLMDSEHCSHLCGATWHSYPFSSIGRQKSKHVINHSSLHDYTAGRFFGRANSRLVRGWVAALWIPAW